MKTWLKAFWDFLIEPWASVLALLVIAIIIGPLLRFMFYLGGWAEEKETAVWRGLVMAAEPEQCALCADKGIMRTYPCLVKLATGQVGQIRLEETEGNICYYFMADCFAIAKGSTTSVTLPEKQQPIDPALFCRDCRTKLAEVSTKGYVLADLHDAEDIRLYPVTDGAVYDIRGYTVEVSGLTITVTGNSE